MFDSSYPLHYCGIDRNKVRPNLIETHLFRFNDLRNHAYIINVERYPDNVFAIKYHLKAHKLSKRKYSLMTGLGFPPKIFASCIDAMVFIYRKHPNASFIVVGAASDGENKDETQRFRIYRYMLVRKFPATLFSHKVVAEDSAYLMLNDGMIRSDADFPQRVNQLYDETISAGE